jgi:S1-C subfamily serine protease
MSIIPELGGDKVETTDVKLLLKNGREIPAKFVLRDKDLDLAFVLPQEQGLNLTYVGLTKGPVPEPLDDLVFLYRMGKVMNREAGVALGRVEAVVKKPRTFVVPELLTGLQSLGCPVFDATGRPLGVVVIRRSPAALKDIGGVRDVLEVLKPVVLTAEDIQQAASQVDKPKEEPK